MTFKRIPHAGPTLRFTFDGASLEAVAGDSVAAALLAAGIDRIRTTPKSGEPRLPYCLMGVCFECLVEIDGARNRQACMVEVRHGMDVRRQAPTGELGR